jgi:hypothetical protein
MDIVRRFWWIFATTAAGCFGLVCYDFLLNNQSLGFGNYTLILFGVIS